MIYFLISYFYTENFDIYQFNPNTILTYILFGLNCDLTLKKKKKNDPNQIEQNLV